MKQKSKSLSILVLFFTLCAVATYALAQSGWIVYKSETGIFDVRIPDEFETKVNPFRIDESRILQNAEIASVIDQRPFRNSIKSYIVKIDQTLGPSFTDADIHELIDDEIKTYSRHYSKLGGIIKKKKKGMFRNVPGVEIYITFEDPDLGTQGMRTRTIFLGVTRLRQTITGPDHIMYSYKSKDFFDSLIMYPGIATSKGAFGKDWEFHTSPLGIFTVALPPVNEPYVPKEPIIKSSKKSEVIKHIIHDPVLDYNIFYNVYGYKFDRNLTYADVRQVLVKRHISKYGVDPSTLKFDRIIVDKIPTMQTDMTVYPPRKVPYLNYVRLKVFFKNNYMMVQEVMSSKALAKSGFTDNIMKLAAFHPESAVELINIKNKANAAPKQREEENYRHFD